MQNLSAVPFWQCRLWLAPRPEPRLQKSLTRFRSKRALQGKDARVPFTKNAAFFELAAEATDNSNLGLEFAQSRDTRDAGLLGFVGLNSPTVKHALKNLSRYRHVMSDALEINVDELDSKGTVRWWRRGLAPARCRQYMEFGTTNLIRGLRAVTGRKVRPVRVTFAHARNARIREFERFFGCPVEFGRRANLIELSQTDLDVPIIDADKRLLDVLPGYCTEVLAKHRKRRPSLIETVERLIVDRLSSDEARIDIVAKELAVSRRTFSRALAKLGTSFHAIVETLRKDLALEILKAERPYFERDHVPLRLHGHQQLQPRVQKVDRQNAERCPLSGVKRTSVGLKEMSAVRPERLVGRALPFSILPVA